MRAMAHGSRLLWQYDAQLAEQASDPVDQCRPLFDEALTRAVYEQFGLLINGLDRLEPHGRPSYCFAIA